MSKLTISSLALTVALLGFSGVAMADTMVTKTTVVTMEDKAECKAQADTKFPNGTAEQKHTEEWNCLKAKHYDDSTVKESMSM